MANRREGPEGEHRENERQRAEDRERLHRRAAHLRAKTARRDAENQDRACRTAVAAADERHVPALVRRRLNKGDESCEQRRIDILACQRHR